MQLVGHAAVELGEELVDLGPHGVFDACGVALLEEAEEVFLELEREAEIVEEVVQIEQFRQRLLAGNRGEIGLVLRVVDAGARVEEPEDALVVVTAQFDETLDLVQVGVDRLGAERLERGEEILELPRDRVDLVLGAERLVNAFRHAFVREVALPLLLRRGKAAVDQIIEIALRDADVRIGDRRPGELGQRAHESAELIDRLGESGEHEILLVSVVGRAHRLEKAAEPPQLRPPPRLVGIPGEQAREEVAYFSK